MATLLMTDRWLANLTGTGKPEAYVDTKRRGLTLRVSADGRAKSWSVVYRRRADGKKSRVAIGRYPEFSLAEARDMALGHMAAVSKGDDPAAERRNKGTTVATIADLVEEYLARATAHLRSRVELERRLRVYVVPQLGRTPLADWHRRDVALLLDRLKVPKAPDKKKPKGKRQQLGGPAIANRVYDDLKALASWAVRTGYLDLDPLAHLARPAPLVRRDRVLSSEEVVSVLTKLDTAAGITPALRRIIRLLFFTGCRVSEIAELETSELDLQAKVIRLPAERTKNARPFVVPLVPEAMALLREQLAENEAAEVRRAARQHREPRAILSVFPSARGDGPVDGKAPNVALRRHFDHLGTEPFTPHDIRRTTATGMGELGVLPHTIEVVLNHVSGFRAGVGGTYNRSAYEREHRAALERWAGHLQGLLSAGSNLVALRAGERS